ncbi:MAG: hypothetical protein FH751_02140 [Firmicutes bacterium]|nr:hypothetical protein [Bacillota bacterium]
MDKLIDYTLTKVETLNRGKEEITITNKDDKTILTITKMLTCTGCDMEVEGIEKDEDNYNVYIKLIKPCENKMNLQVITYKEVTLEIDNENLDKDYKFNIIWK